MLSRAGLVMRRTAILQSQHLAHSAAGDSQRPRGDFQCRHYHKANEVSHLLARKVLGHRSVWHASCAVSARNLSTTPVARSAAADTSSAVASTATLPIPSIPDAPTVPEVVDLVASDGEPPFLSIGLGGWSPPGLIQSALEYLHVDLGLPWWTSIVIGTICVRILVIPIVIISQRNAATLNNVMPEMQKIQMKVTEARQIGNPYEVSRCTHELMVFMKENKCNPIKGALVPMAQFPIFLSFFMAIRQMVNAPVESLETGGILWFQNLTLCDPYYLLPIITSATLCATIELGVDTGRLNASNMPNMRYALRAIPLLIFPFTMNFPAAMLCYWTSTNFISLLQVGVLKIGAVRDFCRIPRMITHDQAALPMKKKKFIAGLKESWSNIKLSNELEHRRRLDQLNFERAGQGTIVRTYKFDPTKTRPAEAAKKV